MRPKYEMKKPERLNLIPILDAIFIFIFFLLMSAQFLDAFEIGSNLPMIKDIKDKPDPKEPLNLTLEIKPEVVVVYTGSNNRVKKGEYRDDEMIKMRSMLQVLKVQNPDEKVVTIDSGSKIPFHRLVNIIDHTQKNEYGKNELFHQIVFKK